MPKAPMNPHVPSRWPPPVEGLTLSTLISETEERGLELAFDADRGRRSVWNDDDTLLEAESLAYVKRLPDGQT